MNKKEFALWSAIVVSSILLMVFSVNYYMQSLKGTAREFKSDKMILEEYLGKEVEIHNDTLMIVNYSVFSMELELSNGVSIKKSVADRCLINAETEQP